jgi:REP element-mobilizing transposase RayT
MSYRQILYQIVFSTKYRQPTIADEHCNELYRYIWGVINNKDSKLFRINGIEDHIHILCDLHPSVALADLVNENKSELFSVNESQRFLPGFHRLERRIRRLYVFRSPESPAGRAWCRLR